MSPEALKNHMGIITGQDPEIHKSEAVIPLMGQPNINFKIHRNPQQIPINIDSKPSKIHRNPSKIHRNPSTINRNQSKIHREPIKNP